MVCKTGIRISLLGIFLLYVVHFVMSWQTSLEKTRLKKDLLVLFAQGWGVVRGVGRGSRVLAPISLYR